MAWPHLGVTRRLLVGIDGDEAVVLAERLRAACTADLRSSGLPVTMSAGVADLGDAPSSSDLFRRADRALYWAKHHGRDQAVRYEPSSEYDDSAAQHTYQHARALTGLTALVRAVDAKDPATLQHADRVADLAEQLAVRLGWAPERCARLREAALLHDVGKIGVPDAILTKPGPLTPPEFEQIKAHSALGARIVEDVLDDEQVSWVRGHHERPDGSGYPDGLPAERIPDGALLLAVADTYETLTSGRCYKRPRAAADAVSEMRAHAGAQFPANLIDALERWALGKLPRSQPADATPNQHDFAARTIPK